MSKQILLSQNQITIVDEEDFITLNKFKWCANWNKGNYYAVRNQKLELGKKTVFMAREILHATLGLVVDHINGNTLDNRKENLRLCTNQENLRNRKTSNSNNVLGIKGVCKLTGRYKFKAEITINSKIINLGHFNVLGDADSARRFAEEKYFINKLNLSNKL